MKESNMLEFKFKQPSTNREISYNTDKSFVVIYGKNGTGKTTLSRNSSFDKNFVFNEDYINRNVYSTSHDGTNITPENRKNISSLWLGEEVIKVAKQRELYEDLNKKVKNTLSLLSTDYKAEIEKYGLLNKISISQTNIEDYKVDLNPIFSHLEQLSKNFVSGVIVETSIKNDDEFEEKNIVLKNDLILSSFVGKIMEIELVKELIFDRTDGVLQKLNSQLIDIGESVDHLRKIETELENISTERSETNLIFSLLKLHEKYQSRKCLFCGNESIEDVLDKWRRVFYDKFREQKEELIVFLTYLRNSISEITSDDNYSLIDIEIINYLKSLCEKVSCTLDGLNKNIIKCVDAEPYKQKSAVVIKTEELIADLSNYVLVKYIDELVFWFNVNQYINNMISTTKEEIDKLMSKEALDYQTGIQKVLVDLGLDKDLTIKLNKRSSSFTYDIQIKGQEISTLSDGQKHRLALALFLYSLQGKDLSNKTIVLDDPYRC